MKILYAASEAYPLIKTGGLGDVVYSLPRALNQLGDSVRLVLPGYGQVLDEAGPLDVVAEWDIPGAGTMHRVRILQTQLEGLGERLYLVEVPALFGRPGNPYVQENGIDWPDNAERFTVFSRAVAMLALESPDPDWRAEVVHCHDWQTGLVPAFLSQSPQSPATVFTIHNLSYDGYFSHQDFTRLHLPAAWWSPDYIEFYGGFSMLKAGMVFSDRVTTVSPSYAKEICTPEFGYRFDGLLLFMGDKLTGIMNGIDLDTWNPASDRYLAAPYGAIRNRIKSKRINKTDLLQTVGLPDNDAPLLGFIGRLVHQKGIDLVAAMLPKLFEVSTVQVVILGSGDKLFESSLLALEKQHPERLHVYIGYSESLAHKIEAGCDLFLMPSRFEPCGLNQMYSLHYGTPPIVNNTGGLADTVVDTTPSTLKNRTANGFIFREASADALLDCTLRALDCLAHPRAWHQVCRTGMQQALGWEASARHYQQLYQLEISP
ncbi:MAG TPA: glycogen synthase GlgA [Gammaproteobacteria bacterium]|nr:glycogen synthase GlgA [Gammaproteobacteria bacterium]